MSFANVCKMRIPPFSWQKISVFMLQSSFLDSHVLFVCSTPILASKHLNLSQLNSHVQGKTQSFTSRFVCWCSSNLHMFSIKPKNEKFDRIRSYLTWTTWNVPRSCPKKCGFLPRDVDWTLQIPPSPRGRAARIFSPCPWKPTWEKPWKNPQIWVVSNCQTSFFPWFRAFLWVYWMFIPYYSNTYHDFDSNQPKSALNPEDWEAIRV